MEVIQKKNGRPTKIKPEYTEQVYKLCLLGLNDLELAQFFSVNETTIINWKNGNSEFAESYKKGKLLAEAQVAAAYFKRAVGYTYTETHFEKLDGKENLELTPTELITTEQYKKKVIIKEMPAEPSACMNILKNKKKKYWGDKIEIDHTVKKEVLDLTQYTDAELRTLIDLQSKGRISEA